jgi:hypothetical protein
MAKTATSITSERRSTILVNDPVIFICPVPSPVRQLDPMSIARRVVAAPRSLALAGILLMGRSWIHPCKWYLFREEFTS